MYNRIKSTLLKNFNKNQQNISKEDKKKYRHSLHEYQSTSYSIDDSTPITWLGHAPLAPPEEDEEGGGEGIGNHTQFEGSHYNNNYQYLPEYPLDSIMSHFTMTWSLQFLGSFPISNLGREYIGQRLERFQPTQTPPQNIELAVSLHGVQVSCEQTVLMSHSLRRVSNVIGRPSNKQVAYIAMEPAGRTYRRLCHVFLANDVKQIEEIESVLGQAFVAHSGKNSEELGTETKGANKLRNSATTTNVNSSNSATMSEKRSVSTVFLNRFLGKKGSQTVDDPACKRKRRPVSAVFTSAIHRLSNSTSSVNSKRMTTIDITSKKDKVVPHHIRSSSPVIEEQRRNFQSSNSESDIENRQQQKYQPHRMCSSSSTESASSSSSVGSAGSTSPPSRCLIYDDKLAEWIVPMDASTTAQLENCNYFVGLPTRESLAKNLLSHPEGAFVLRYSESKRKCLALSMRVPTTHNPTGISHYLIIRNEHGFRLKLTVSNKPYATLQMLLTHHSVMEGHLPCRLTFVQWDKNAWKQQATIERTPAPTTAHRSNIHRHSTALTKIDENRNLATTNGSNMLLNRHCGIEDFATPKRRSRHDLNAIRRSQFFDLDDRRAVI